MPQNIWSEDETKIIHEHYATLDKDMLRELLPNRTWKAIMTKAQRICLARPLRLPSVLTRRNKSPKQRKAVSKAMRGRDITWGEKVRNGVLKAYAEGRLIPRAGEKNGHYGKPVPLHVRLAASENLKGLNQDPEFQARRAASLQNETYRRTQAEEFAKRKQEPSFNKRRLKALCQKPTRPERELLNLINEHQLPYRYVGDGSFLIEGFNPDFVNINGKKHVIEVFGRVWHEDLVKDWKRTELGRIMVFNSYGFKTLIIWEEELKHKDAVIEKIRCFDAERR